MALVFACGAGGASTTMSRSLPPCQTATATGCDKSKIVSDQPGTCEGKGLARITASPIAFADLAYIQLMGLEVGGHVTPIDHGYFYVKGTMANPATRAAVYAPLDGIVTVVTHTSRTNATGGSYEDYSITIAATCTFRVRFSNMLGYAGGLTSAVGQLPSNESRTPNYAVKAGEMIGYTGLPTAYGIDVWVETTIQP